MKSGDTNDDRRLYFIGGGITPECHLTLQGQYILNEVDFIAYLSPHLSAFLGQFGDKSEDISDLYVDGGKDYDNYRAILDFLFKKTKAYNKVALVENGNPRFGVTLVGKAIEESKQEDVIVKVIPGISSFDSLIIDVNRDPLEYGSVVIDSNRLLLFDLPITQYLDYYIYHPASVGNTNTDYSNPSQRNKIHFLQDKLLTCFDTNHTCCLVCSAGDGNQPHEIITTTIGSLSDVVSKITFGMTLFVPATSRPEINSEFLSLLTN